jgi:DMSO/TMAO reductase YedYZ heme-binding membrane subunit
MRGPRIFAAAASFVAFATAVILAAAGAGERGMHLLLRTTALASLTFFLCAFVASPLHALRPGGAAEWLVDNRRYLGLSFAVSHFVHLVAIVELVRITARSPSAVTLVIGGIGYVLLFAMAATSSDAAIAWLGARRWRQLHSFGLHYLWGVFTLTLLDSVLLSAVAALAELALVGAMALRLTVWIRRRARSVLRPA